jgi:hypothetical protein
MAVPRGLEPPTFGLGNRCSILLSYGTRLILLAILNESERFCSNFAPASFSMERTPPVLSEVPENVSDAGNGIRRPLSYPAPAWGNNWALNRNSVVLKYPLCRELLDNIHASLYALFAHVCPDFGQPPFYART